MNLERAAGYLASGCSTGQTASIMGCSPGYISQLMRDEKFMKLVEEKKKENNGSEEAESQDIQKKYTGLEHQLIKAMGDALSNAELPAITRALEVVATRQEKAAIRKLPAGHPIHGGNRVGNTVVVSLQLPAHAIPNVAEIQVNEKNEVIAIDGRAMSPMSSNAVEKMFRGKKEKEIEEAAVKRLEEGTGNREEFSEALKEL